ncbi:Glycosyl transferase, family 14-containing protein [Aphelenchoides bicaudatus]|nr:Glycosyl transferase, family 14-containing protein [Aphelenchoides bicaudatus]
MLTALEMYLYDHYNLLSIFSSSSTNRSIYFIRPETTKHLPCGRFFDPEYDHVYLGPKFRVTYKDPVGENELPTDCVSILARNNFYLKPMSKQEEEFPLAYAQNAFKDYRFLEMILSTTYAPQNFYCYSIDGNADKLFRKRMTDLASCFPNVHITDFKAKMDSNGHNTNAHHMACIEWLASKRKQWKYVMLLQNYDVPLKTNEELVQIFKWYNGTNDIATQIRRQCQWFDCFLWARHKWDFNTLKLYKDSARNNLTVNNAKPELIITRSLVQDAISRQAIDFIFENMNLTIAIQQFNANRMMMSDEVLWSSLNSNDNIQLPGGFTQKCDGPVGTITSMSRFNVWIVNLYECHSKITRHELCVFGMEDLYRNLADNPYFFANKMVPEYDFGAIVCWNEMLFNRTHFDKGLHRLDKGAYVKLPHVRFNRAKQKFGKKFDVNRFDCAKYIDQQIGTIMSRRGIANIL